jgi:glutamate--cysteine ligase
MVPHFVTAAPGPIQQLEQTLLESTPAIERWFRLEWQEHTPPFYGSVDLRNAGFKLAPVGTNLFPGGFNHLSDAMLPLAVQAAMAGIEKYCPDARSLLLIPDDNVSDQSYLNHLLHLASILRQTGLEVRMGSLNPAITQNTVLALDDGRTLTLEPLQRNGKRIGLPGFDPCAVLLNNDLLADTSPLLEGLQGQTLLPPLHAGWAVRRKSRHFAVYQDVSKRFAKLFGIDPWLLNPYFTTAASQSSLETAVEQVLKQMRTKYKEYGLKHVPFVTLTADASSDPMQHTRVTDVSDLAQLEPTLVAQEVLVQEGIPAVASGDQGAGEPVVYTMDRYVVGGFYRVNNERGTHLKPLPFAAGCNTPDCISQAKTNRFYAYGVVARLAILSASIELERTDPDQSLHGN